MKVLGIIPARYESTRFPGKPLAVIGNKLMIERVYQQIQKSELINDVIVATDDLRIVDAVLSFGGKVEMTNTSHTSGTNRCIEVAERHPEFDVYINIQGDEPFIQPGQIDVLATLFKSNTAPDIATLAKPITTYEALDNENVVKVVMDIHQKALYFSRHPIPFIRGIPPENWLEKGKFYKHIGMYGFRAEILSQLKSIDQGFYYKLEKLEQLQWLEYGLSIKVAITNEESMGIDTPEDLENAIKWLKETRRKY